MVSSPLFPQADLTDIPVWNQLADPSADGVPDPYAASDCGEECASMRIFYKTGIELDEGTIRRLIPGHQMRGETTPSELVNVMRIFGLRPVAASIRGNALQSRLANSIAHKVPPIVLGTWVDSTVDHYVLGVASSSAGLTVNDPWEGVRRVIPWTFLIRLYSGWCIL